METKKELQLTKKETMDLFHYIEHIATEHERILAMDALILCMMKHPYSNSITIPETRKGFSVIYKYYKQFYKV